MSETSAWSLIQSKWLPAFMTKSCIMTKTRTQLKFINLIKTHIVSKTIIPCIITSGNNNDDRVPVMHDVFGEVELHVLGCRLTY